VRERTREGEDGKRADRGGRGWEGGGENRKGEGEAEKIQRLIYDPPPRVLPHPREENKL